MDLINSVWTPVSIYTFNSVISVLTLRIFQMISEGNYFSKGYWEHLEPNADTELVASRSTGVITLLSKSTGNEIIREAIINRLLNTGEYVMGVKATSLGHATYDVRPQMGELTRINGTAATSRGQVSLDLRKDSSGAMNWTITPMFCKYTSLCHIPSSFFGSHTFRADPSDATVYVPTTADFIMVNGKNLSTTGSTTDLPWGVAAISKNNTDYTVKVHLVGTTEFNILA